MRKRLSTIILSVVFFVGLGLLAYPTFSDYWNSLHQTRAISHYREQVAGLNDVSYDELRAAARKYNERLLEKPRRFELTREEQAEYEALLNVSGDGMMGYIEIPAIGCSLPFYHGTDEVVLQSSVGHIEGSSLPTGGTGTHCVLSGHRGLPSAKLFTDLDRLREGDTFVLTVLDETLTYEVDQILIVEPDEVDALNIDPEQDYCTLLTCTPYGINTHRMLVRGHRVENEGADGVRVTADAIQIEPVLVAPMIAALLLAVILLVWFLTGRIRK